MRLGAINVHQVALNANDVTYALWYWPSQWHDWNLSYAGEGILQDIVWINVTSEDNLSELGAQYSVLQKQKLSCSKGWEVSARAHSNHLDASVLISI